jgi:hypothetical protein
MQVKFKNRTFRVEKHRYGNGGVALVLENVNKEPDDYIRATVNVPSVSLSEEQVLIKTWAENEGLLEVLEAAGVVSVENRAFELDDSYGEAALCRLLI